MIELREYESPTGVSPFGRWFDDLHHRAAQKVTTALYRMRQGNFSNVKGVGKGVFEFRIRYGPGYRIYFGKDGELMVILLAGGDKSSQRNDIAAAHVRWDEYKSRKRNRR